jgi:hypothetical protein
MWKRIRKRAEELAMNRGMAANQATEHDVRRAERELLGLQTLPNPEDPLTRNPL